MSDPAKPHLSQSAIVGTLSSQIVQLQDENKRLRTALADCGTTVGGVVAPQCSLDFLECISQEVRLVTERLRHERAAALQDAERAREERNRVGLDVRREWMHKAIDIAKERDHWKANHNAQVLRARFLIERGDIPPERVRAFEEMAILRELEEAIRHDREIFAGTSDETNPMGQLITEALDKLDAMRKS
jgi:hypothetical protein